MEQSKKKIDLPKFDHVKKIDIAFQVVGRYVNVYLVDTWTDENGEVHEYTLAIKNKYDKTKNGKSLENRLLAMCGYFDVYGKKAKKDAK